MSFNSIDEIELIKNEFKEILDGYLQKQFVYKKNSPESSIHVIKTDLIKFFEKHNIQIDFDLEADTITNMVNVIGKNKIDQLALLTLWT